MPGNLLAKLSTVALIQQFYLYISHGDDFALEAEHAMGLHVCRYSTLALLAPFCHHTSIIHTDAQTEADLPLMPRCL